MININNYTHLFLDKDNEIASYDLSKKVMMLLFYIRNKSDEVITFTSNITTNPNSLMILNHDASTEFISTDADYVKHQALGKVLKTNVWINEKSKSTVVLQSYQNENGHYPSYVSDIQIALTIPKLMPWHFDIPFSQHIDFNTILSLNSTKGESKSYSDRVLEFEQKFEEIFNSSDIAKNVLRLNLQKAFAEAQLGAKSDIERKIADNNTMIQRYQNDLNNKIKEKHRLDKLYMSLEIKDELFKKECNEFLYVVDNYKGFQLLETHSSYVDFRLLSDLNSIDLELIDILCNTRSSLYHHVSTEHREKAVKFMKKVFIEKEYGLQVYTDIRYDLKSATITFINQYDRPLNYTVQPHLQRNSCMGDYRSDFNNAAMERDVAGLVDIGLAANRCLSLTDSIVCRGLSEQVFSGNHKCIRKQDGTIVSYSDIEGDL